MARPIPPRLPRCERCGESCRSAIDCLARTRAAGHPVRSGRGRSRGYVLTPLGWAMSKYGRDPRAEAER